MDDDLLVMMTNKNKELQLKIKKFEMSQRRAKLKILYYKKLYNIFEYIFTLASAFCMMFAIIGLFLERFQYIYDGWFNKYSWVLVIIGLILLYIPTAVTQIGHIKWKKKK